MTENVIAYLNILKEIKDEKPELTENGKIILKYMQEGELCLRSGFIKKGLYQIPYDIIIIGDSMNNFKAKMKEKINLL